MTLYTNIIPRGDKKFLIGNRTKIHYGGEITLENWG